MVRTGSALLAIVLAAPVWAAPKVVGVEASISAQSLPAGSNFDVVVSAEIEGEAGELPWPEIQLPPELSLGGRSRSQESRSQITWINGSFQKSNTTIVRLRQTINTTKPGVFAVGPVRFQGRDLGTGRISVEARPDPSSETSREVRTSTIVPRRQVWVGQQIPFTWRLEADRAFEPTSIPDIQKLFGQGFHSVLPDSQARTVVVKSPSGRPTARTDVRGSLFALRAGKQVLPGTQLGWRMFEGGSVDPFEAFFRGEDMFEAMRRQPRVKEGVSRTESVPLEVRAVPDAGRPREFQGGVGDFRLEASLDSSVAQVGRSLTLILRLTGNGQPQASGLPVWTAPEGLEAYPAKDTWSSSWKKGELVTTLERRIVLVPRRSGRIAMDSVRFAWFDPDRGAFAQARVGLPDLQVAPAPASKGTPGADSTRIAPAPSGEAAWALFGKVSAGIWSLLALGFLGWLAVRTLRDRLSERSRRARSLARISERLLREASRGVPDLALVHKEFVAAIAVVHGELASGWTSRELESHLSGSRPLQEAQEAAQLLRDLEAARFGGVPLENAKARLEGAMGRLRESLATPG